MCTCGGIRLDPNILPSLREASQTALCFTGALHKEGERTAFDITKCTGCGLCHLACPFGVVRLAIAPTAHLCAGFDSPTCIKTCPGKCTVDRFRGGGPEGEDALCHHRRPRRRKMTKVDAGACIGCLSCSTVCPSQEHNPHVQRRRGRGAFTGRGAKRSATCAWSSVLRELWLWYPF